jgi:protein Tex
MVYKKGKVKQILEKKYVDNISGILGIGKKQVENTIGLLEDGSTIPFISRYRKEATGGLDETRISEIRDKLSKLLEIDNRRQTIISEIEKQGKMTGGLKKQIAGAETLTELEDIYLPYRPKKKTRGTAAKEKGLEGLAEIIFKQKEIDPEKAAGDFLNENVKTIEEAMQGARDIIAEWINEDKKARESIRQIFEKEAVIKSEIHKGLEESGSKYRDYFDFEQELKKCPSHRLLAMRRGEKEEYLKVSIKVNREGAVKELEKIFIKNSNSSSEQVRLAAADSCRRLLLPSVENEFARISKKNADMEAIKVFVSNLRQLLMAPVLGGRRVMAIDPGFRTGCKVVLLNEQGDLISNDTIFPNAPRNDREGSEKILASLVCQYDVEAVAIGNGTAGRETEEFVKGIEFAKKIPFFMVSESGASIYSASKTAREEFPDQDVTVRGAVSIGRRLMDPLAELVKIDPKNLGIGQYQHDVDQVELKKSLGMVVESCVNTVGVNLNTASRHLLMHISGLGPGLASSIVDHRTVNGPFRSRKELLEVAGLGEKAYEQCGGFLRIQDGENPLDNSAVHPESYYIVEKMARDLKMDINSLIKDDDAHKRINLDNYVGGKAGLPTLKDIMQELAKPGRDPREKISAFEFRKGINSIEDLKTGMVLPGIVTNITNFGAFVDIGIKQDGLVHISNISQDFVKNPAEVLMLNQEVKVKVLDTDRERKRIQLSIKDAS